MREVIDRLNSGPQTQPTRLFNQTCIYCGNLFSAENRPTKEHVVGRRFVPTGSLHQSWSLIANACLPCNKRKGDLEDDLAAITLYPLSTDRPLTVPERDALRRATRSLSRRTGKPVSDSKESVEIVAPFEGGTLTFSATAPPQADDDRINALCLLHVQAFFYMLTYSLESRTGRYWQGVFNVCGSERQSNWGNDRYLAFANEVQSWPYRLISSVANDYFRIMIRRKAEDAVLWAWALEWNKSFRSIGFFGDEELIREQIRQLPSQPMEEVSRMPGSTIRIHADKPLVGPDLLFNIEQALRNVA